MRTIALLIVVLALFQHRHDIQNWLYPPEVPEAGAGAELIMYSTQQCGYCDRAREMFRNKGIPFDERDVNRSREAARQMRELGGRGVPTFVIHDEVITGWNRQVVLAELGYR